MIRFQNIPKDLQEVFTSTYDSYSALKSTFIIVRRRQLKASTMRAQPFLMGTLPWKWKLGYRIDVGYTVRSTDIKVDDLPKKVQAGWFAHELGHVEDYLGRGFFGNIWLGLNYVLRKKYAKKVEWQADKNALRAGFYDVIKSTKLYLAGIGDGKKGYSKKLVDLYMSLDDFETCNLEFKARIEQLAE